MQIFPALEDRPEAFNRIGMDRADVAVFSVMIGSSPAMTEKQNSGPTLTYRHKSLQYLAEKQKQS
jgi:hypothetical protein